MSQANINVVASVLGQTVPIEITRSQDGNGAWTPNVPAGNAGTLTTRTDNSTGVATLGDGHGLQTGDVVDVFWTGGRHYGMTANVSGDAISLSAGAGDNLPAVSTAVVVCKRQVVHAGFDPNQLTVLLVTATRRVSVVFVDASGATLLALDMAAGDCCLWWSNSGIALPMTGNPVAAVWVSNGDSTADVDITIAAVYDATP
jgi:hypothetical protein